MSNLPNGIRQCDCERGEQREPSCKELWERCSNQQRQQIADIFADEQNLGFNRGEQHRISGNLANDDLGDLSNKQQKDWRYHRDCAVEFMFQEGQLRESY